MTHIRILIVVSFLFASLISCDRPSKEQVNTSAEAEPTVIIPEDNLSTLSFPLDFPITELSKLLNNVLPPILVDEKIALKKDGEHLLLKVSPIGEVLLNAYGKNLDVSIPIEVSANIKKKVMGIDVKNKKPIRFQMRVDLHTKLLLGDD